MDTHVCVCVCTRTRLFLWTFHWLLLLLYWPNNIFYSLTLNLRVTENHFLSPNPKPTRYRKPVCIVTLQINIIDYFEYIYIYFPSWRPQAGPHRTFGVKNVRFYYPCGDIWSPQCSINKYTHTHTHTQNLTISTRFLMEFKHCFSHQSQR